MVNFKTINMKIFKTLVLAFFFVLIWNSKYALAQSTGPIILETTLLKADYGNQIMVKGLVEKNNLVLIYINGEYYGFANISNNDPELNSFSYLSPLIKNKTEYNYKVFAIARNQDNLKLSPLTESSISSIIEESSFKATDKDATTYLKPSDKTAPKKYSIPAPTLITPKGNIGEYKPIISGFSKNQTKVKLFIDNNFENEFWVNDNDSGTASFKYTPEKELTRGLHFVHATAMDKNNYESKNSNILYFFIADPQYLATSTSINEGDQASSSAFQKNKEATGTKNLINKEKSINSALNLSLFFLFVLGVIIWIITTNLELKKDNPNNEPLKKEEGKKS